MLSLSWASARLTKRPVVRGLPCLPPVDSSEDSPLSSASAILFFVGGSLLSGERGSFSASSESIRMGDCSPPDLQPPLPQGCQSLGWSPFCSSFPSLEWPVCYSRARRCSRTNHSSSECRISIWSRRGPVSPSLPSLARSFSPSLQERAYGPRRSTGLPPSPLRCYAHCFCSRKKNLNFKLFYIILNV